MVPGQDRWSIFVLFAPGRRLAAPPFLMCSTYWGSQNLTLLAFGPDSDGMQMSILLSPVVHESNFKLKACYSFSVSY